VHQVSSGFNQIRRALGDGFLVRGVAVLIGLGAAPVAAHHGFQAEFDSKKPVTLDGVMTRIVWVNPHAWIYVRVADQDGRGIEWAVQAAGPEALTRRGWRPDSLVPGMKVLVEGFRARTGEPVANGRDVSLPDGRTLCANIPCRSDLVGRRALKADR
jgi:hypothetical protein